ncbi:uncharacterized protein isoform X2 [Macaca fascicularis]|uniref:uncharacterized protein isoform X2 n=1 Tax=Macaca fascicularis TaxID=9541 RepID=UPI0032B0594B
MFYPLAPTDLTFTYKVLREVRKSFISGIVVEMCYRNFRKKTTRVSLTISSPANETSNNRSSYSTLVQPLYINTWRHLQDIPTIRDQPVMFECRIQDTATVQVHWYRQNVQITNSDDLRILRKRSLHLITEAFPEDSEEFKCIAENEAGTAASTAKLFVSPERKVVEKSESPPKLSISKLSPKLASSPWSTESYTKDTNPDDTTINFTPIIPEPVTHNEHEIQFPKKDFCTISGNTFELQAQ